MKLLAKRLSPRAFVRVLNSMRAEYLDAGGRNDTAGAYKTLVDAADASGLFSQDSNGWWQLRPDGSGNVELELVVRIREDEQDGTT